ncbi:hypothetical protein GcC1_069025 [Golovinomyces cichoracearum]|uniref:Uncharacterized protein n=1 Tax=Golovinomyces cichoracearum TaxID=62708 RepID=A0A420IQI3_9PEZI|nr:hypothetical protein GcC1_069025 [Golovinomyces cichoracearum]
MQTLVVKSKTTFIFDTFGRTIATFVSQFNFEGKKNKTEDTPVTLALQDLKNMQVKGVNPLNTPDNHLQQYAEWILHAYNSNKIDLNSIPES